jgi:signal transduction histidine kinase
MLLDRFEWPSPRDRSDIAWVAFAIANLIAMDVWPRWETVPFHFIWVSMTIVYGFRVWGRSQTLWTLGLVAAGTGLVIWLDVLHHTQPLDELTEVPLMSAMFAAMVWHARRRRNALQETERVSRSNLRLLERERRFVQDASHELRTPITVALGHAELIRRSTADPTIQNDSEVVVEELLRLRRLSERLLMLAASEDPNFLNRSPTDLDELVLGALRRWSHVPRRWLLGRLDEAKICCDADRVALALDALIENAVQHTTPNDVIALSATNTRDSVIVTVKDSGEGIQPSHLDQLFERFARVDVGRSRDEGGMGLGLAIVAAIAEAHGGSVSVRSNPHDETLFEFRLAAEPAGEPDPSMSSPTAGDSDLPIAESRTAS